MIYYHHSDKIYLMKFINYKTNQNIKKDIEPLYISSFPEEERPPVEMFFSFALKKDNDIYGVYDNNSFIGFTNLLFYKDLCYLFFLAVSTEFRNKGYGSQIVQEVLKKYPNKNFILCYDEIDDKYQDNSLRIRRRDFYYRNGFKDNELKTCEYGVRYDTCYYGSHKVSFEDYQGLFIHCYGPQTKKIVKKAK